MDKLTQQQVVEKRGELPDSTGGENSKIGAVKKQPRGRFVSESAVASTGSEATASAAALTKADKKAAAKARDAQKAAASAADADKVVTDASILDRQYDKTVRESSAIKYSPIIVPVVSDKCNGVSIAQGDYNEGEIIEMLKPLLSNRNIVPSGTGRYDLNPQVRENCVAFFIKMTADGATYKSNVPLNEDYYPVLERLSIDKCPAGSREYAEKALDLFLRYAGIGEALSDQEKGELDLIVTKMRFGAGQTKSKFGEPSLSLRSRLETLAYYLGLEHELPVGVAAEVGFLAKCGDVEISTNGAVTGCIQIQRDRLNPITRKRGIPEDMEQKAMAIEGELNGDKFLVVLYCRSDKAINMEDGALKELMQSVFGEDVKFSTRCTPETLEKYGVVGGVITPISVAVMPNVVNAENRKIVSIIGKSDTMPIRTMADGSERAVSINSLSANLAYSADQNNILQALNQLPSVVIDGKEFSCYMQVDQDIAQDKKANASRSVVPETLVLPSRSESSAAAFEVEDGLGKLTLISSSESSSALGAPIKSAFSESPPSEISADRKSPVLSLVKQVSTNAPSH